MSKKVRVKFSNEQGVRFAFLDAKFAVSPTVVEMGGRIIDTSVPKMEKKFDVIEVTTKAQSAAGESSFSTTPPLPIAAPPDHIFEKPKPEPKPRKKRGPNIKKADHAN